jgi:Leucine-rich repeat (LRR) protein
MKNLKRKIYYLLTATIFISSTCEKPKEKEEPNQIIMKTATIKSVSFDMAGNNKDTITINWGDGAALERDTLSAKPRTYRHDYASEATQTITITGNVTYLYSNYSNLTRLDLTQCDVLEKLYCGNNRLSTLDASKCPVLKYLDCSDNSFSATALDKLFGTLNSAAISGKTIERFSNPGCEDCDRTIAEKRGWFVGDCW